jgi:hypothetical protein
VEGYLLQKGHCNLSKTIKRTDLRRLVDHILAYFGLPQDQSVAAIGSRFRQQEHKLEHELPGFPPPEKCVQCEGCLGWFLASAGKYPLKNIHQHQRRTTVQSCLNARKAGLDDYRSEWAVQVLAGGNNMGTRLLTPFYDPATAASGRGQLQGGGTPPPQPDPGLPPQLHPYYLRRQDDHSLPRYFEQLGWSEYVKASSATDWEVAVYLARTPKKNEFDPSWTERECRVEKGLCKANQFLAEYLEDAEEEIKSLNETFKWYLGKGR